MRVSELETAQAIVLSKLPRYFKDGDPLAELVPERRGVVYGLHPEKWHSTFYSLTNKDVRKIKHYQPRYRTVPPGTLVGDMAIANRFYRTEDPKLAAKLAQEYQQSLRPYDQADISQYRMPELLMPAGSVAEKWSNKYKRSIDCNNPKGFSQRAHCQGREKNESLDQDVVENFADGKKPGSNSYKLKRIENVAQSVTESQTAKAGIVQTDVYGTQAYHAKCLEPGCDWESKRYDRIQQAQDAAKKHSEQHFKKKQGVAEGRDFDRCYDKACQLYDKAQAKNLQPKLVQVADFRGDGSNADQRWTKLPQHVWQHYVVIVGDQVLDPTARQFGPDMPTQYHVSDLDRLWGKQYKIRPREGVEENFADGRKPGRKGLAKRMGVDCSKSVAALRKLAAASSGEKQRMPELLMPR